MTDEPQTEDPMVAALLRERVGLVQRGLEDRVAQVDEQLALRGYEPPTGERAAAAKPSTRSTPPKSRKTRSAETT